ncbi:Proline transporter 1 [Bienertia sinuspersici]
MASIIPQMKSMEIQGKIMTPQTFSLESGPIEDDQIIKDIPPTAHAVGNDSWQQVSLMLITSFNCGWVLSFSKLILVPVGWAWGIPSMLIVGFFSAYSSWVLAGFHFVDGQRFIRYRDIMGFLFGKKLYYLTLILQFSTFVLSNMGFILLGGKALKEINLVFNDTAMRLQYYIIITGVIYCIFAFVVPNLSAMRLWLGVSTFLTFGYIGVLLVVSAKDAKSVANKNYETQEDSTVGKVLSAFGAISAMIVSNNSGMIPEIQSTLQKPAVKNLRKALCMQYTLGLMVYYGVSVAGYWIYGSDVPEYLPKAISGPKWAKVLINLAVFLQNVISQHMFFQPVHEALDTKFLKVEEDAYSRENLKRRFFLRTLLFAANTLVTAAIPFMGDFINLLGSFTLVTLTFIFPSMIFIKARKTAGTGHKAWHWTLIIVFSLLAVATTISAARLIINNVRNYRLFANR